MQLGQYLNQEQHVRVTMTPELKQSIFILQLSNIELDSYLRELEAENPLIEIEWADNSYFSGNKKTSLSVSKHADLLSSTAASRDTLENWIMEQLRMIEYSPEEFKAISYFAGNLDEAGYLSVSLEEASSALQMPHELLESALEKLQSFDPPGIGGRNLQECLALQIRRDLDAYPGALEVVELYLQELAKGKHDIIANELDIDIQEVSNILDYIRSLNPRPGLEFGQSEQQNIIVDAKVYLEKNNYVIEMNRQIAPKVSINTSYLHLLKEKGDREAARYYQEKLRSAEWLIRSLDHRSHTLFKVIYVIVEEQFTFLHKGISGLKPMKLKSIAQKLGVHESTVSRAVKNKFIDTPRGIFELKYFFSNGIQTIEGEQVSSKIIKSRIKDLIAEEDKKKPLSDQKIAFLLNKKGIQISRRTVAKYREEEHILSSSLRRKVSTL